MNMVRKSFSTRIKITRRGKIVRRSMSIDHFRTRKSAKNLRHKSKQKSLDYPEKKIIGYMR